MTKPEPIFTHDLPNLNAQQVEQCNQIYTLPAINVELETGTYHWHWCYSVRVSQGLGVVLEGEADRYQLILTKRWQANNVVEDIRYSDYQASIGCILFSALHEDFLCILEQVFDDRCVVSSLNQVQNSDDPDEFKPLKGCNHTLGFKLSDHLGNVRAQGIIYMSPRQLGKLSQKPKQCGQTSEQRFEQLMFNLPVQIDSVRLSVRELKSLLPGSVIKLDNSSLMENNACVSIVMGLNQRMATIAQTRGKFQFNTVPGCKSGNFNE